MSFGDQLRAFAAKTKSSVEQADRAIKIELFTSVIMDTPVDTGRARGNWQTSAEQPAQGVLERSGEGSALADMEQNLGGEVTYLINNLPYARRLEYGHSGQAPQGMVRRNVARLNQILARAVSAAKR